jgi:hypothetical protein
MAASNLLAAGKSIGMATRCADRGMAVHGDGDAAISH